MAVSFPKLFYKNRLEDAAPVASSTAVGAFDVLNLRDFRPYTWWKAAALPATVTVDSVVASPVDYWGLWGHDLGTQGATVELRGSTDNFAASDVLVDTLSPADDAPFVRLVATASFRYRRLTFTGTTAPSIAIALLGEAFALTVGLGYGFDPLGVELNGDVNRSEQGLPLGTVFEFESFERSLQFNHVTHVWLRSDWEPAWVAHLRGRPHIFSWDPGDHLGELVLANIKGGYSAEHQTAVLADLSYDIAGIRSA